MNENILISLLLASFNLGDSVGPFFFIFLYILKTFPVADSNVKGVGVAPGPIMAGEGED